MTSSLTRREALQAGVAAGTGFWLASQGRVRAASPNEKLNLAIIGVGGRGSANLSGVRGENIVALCDVDQQRAGKAFEKFDKSRRFDDFRVMLDKLENQIDGVVISTPDHTHFHPAMMAMQMGKHCYCEKPMAHSVWEARQMTRLAAEKKVATQLGVQRHTIGNVHRVVELIQAGAIGKVREVHSWVGGSRGMPGIPQDSPPVPDHLNWDLWLGPTEKRPYSPAYVPYKWRFWWDFGTGETGNWGCHILDIPFWALGLTYPTRVDASGPEVHPQTTPKSMTTRFEFPAAEGRGPVVLHWYHGQPPILKEKKLSGKGANTLFIGSDGMLLCGFGMRKLLPEKQFADYKAPEPTIPNSPGIHREWIDACKDGPAATCDFQYSGPLTETVLLGNVAYRGGGFEWNAEKLAADNPKAAKFVKPAFRAGWEL